MGRTKNSVINSIWSILSRIVSLILPFIARTVIIQVLGVEYLGLGSLFNSVLRILNMAELGVGSAIVFSMYKPVAENDTDLICALMNVYKRVYRIIGIVVLVIGMILLPFLPKLIEGSVPADINIYLLYLVYLGNSVVSYWLFAYKSSVLNACQRNDIISKVTIVTNLLMYGMQISLLLLIQNYYLYALALPIFTIIKNIITAYYSTKYYPQYYCNGTIPESLKKDISKRVTGLMMDKVAFASRNAFDSVIVSAFLGLQSVAIYNNYYYILSAISGLMTAVVAAILPSIGNSIALESAEKNERDMKNFFFMYMCISGLCYCFFLNLYQPFMKVWVGDDLRFSTITMVVFSLYFLVEKSENILGNYYDAAGMWWNGRWKGLIEAIANLSLNIILCRLLGVFGVVIATLISMLFVGIPLTGHFMYKCYYHKKAKSYFVGHYMTLLRFAIIGIATFFVGMLIPEGNTFFMTVLCMFGRSIVVLVLFVVLLLLFFGRSEQFKNAKTWIKLHFNVKRLHR